MSEETKTEETPVESKNKKINKMTLSEIDLSLAKTEKNMHGLTSKYARALLSRKEFLKK